MNTMESAASSSGTEKRLSARKDWRGKVIFEDEYGEPLVYIFSENISESGIYLASDIPLQIGTRAFLSFTLPNGAEVRTSAEVVRVKLDATKSGRKNPARIGMGVRFLGLTEDQCRRIRAFCGS